MCYTGLKSLNLFSRLEHYSTIISEKLRYVGKTLIPIFEPLSYAVLICTIKYKCFTAVLSSRVMYMKCATKKLIWCHSLYISMKLANNAILGCMFVTYTNIFKHIMFTVQSDHHGTSIRFHFHVCLKPLSQHI